MLNREGMADDAFYMKKALEEARRGYEEDEIPVGAVVVCGGRILARAHNLTETLTDVTAHAEMQAITAAASALGGKYLDGCTLYVTLEPCVMCAGAIGWAQVKRLVFGTADAKRGYRKFAPQALHPKTEVTEGVMAEEAARLLKDFFRERRRTPGNGGAAEQDVGKTVHTCGRIAEVGNNADDILSGTAEDVSETPPFG